MEDDITDEFAAADLGDARRNRRLLSVVGSLAKAPAASISAAQGGWAETIASCRLLNSPEVSPPLLLAPHQEAVVRRCSMHGCVVVDQDTTEMDFSAMKSLQDMGPLNDENRRGFFLHSLYAVSSDGLPLGLLDFQPLFRDDETFRTSKATHKKRPTGAKESQRWVNGYQRTLELARRVPECEVVSISDREGDIYEVFTAWEQAVKDEPDLPRAAWIIRGSQDRVLAKKPEIQDGPRLFGALEEAPLLGISSFEMKARTGPVKVRGATKMGRRSARTVCLEIRTQQIVLHPPRRAGGVKLPPVSIRAVLAQETGVPEGEEPLRWLLLTSLEIETLEQAQRVVALYRRRWDIEIFHRVLKTGCQVERIQLKSREALLNALALYTVIAWRILYLTHLGRVCPDLPCSSVFEEAEWKSACAVVKRRSSAGEPTLNEFIGIVGKLGGHLGRKSDGPPGAQAIWRGLGRIMDFACAWEAWECLNRQNG